MSSETERQEPAGVGTVTEPVAPDEPAVDRKPPFLSRLANAVAKRRPQFAPTPTDPPSGRSLAGVATWAFFLALGGVIVGMASLVRIIGGTPWWFKPSIVLIGLLGIGLTAGAFVTVQRKRAPWALLAGGTVTLLLGALLMATV